METQELTLGIYVNTPYGYWQVVANDAIYKRGGFEFWRTVLLNDKDEMSLVTIASNTWECIID
jgi:hypothetical protein